MRFMACECDWGSRDHKTFYVRKTETVDGKKKGKWRPVGIICLGCQKVSFKAARLFV